jgi:hypothetical protein
MLLATPLSVGRGSERRIEASIAGAEQEFGRAVKRSTRA